MTTNMKGNLAESKTVLRAVELGYEVYRPIYNARYDLVLNDGKNFLRVQVKYADAKLSNCTGSVAVKLAYENRTGGIYVYKETEVDALVVYIPKIDKLCFFKPEMFVGKYRIHVRYEKSKSNQKKGIIFANDYLW